MNAPRDAAGPPETAAGRPATPDRSEGHPASRRSGAGLDGVNFLMADVQGGVGPYLSIFLAGTRHWQAGPVGVAMAAGSIAGAVCQIPTGLLVDGSRHKRALFAGAGLLVAAATLLVVVFPGFWPVLAAQTILGGASAVIPPAVAALTLGIVGQRLMPARISRNEAFNHGGTFVAAVLAGLCGNVLGTDWIFYLVGIFAVLSALAVRLIDPREVDHDRARGGEAAEHAGRPLRIRDLLGQRPIAIFLAAVVLFHFGNAAMLPFAGQVLAHVHPGSDALALSACIICAQLVMVGISWLVGRAMAAGYGRKSIFLVAYALLPVRGILFSFTTSPYGVVAIQLLDGVAAGIFGVISIVIAADLTRGTGRFNLMQGLVALAVGAGASLSNAIGGYVVQDRGYPTGFLTLAGIAVLALLFFLLLMPETGGAGAPAWRHAAPGIGASGR
ncbi:MAG TPA: MFS transporter [Acetobacteraceae bacterium]|nr:MFS transporter [Acetobacteraceae bacterium]